MGVVNDLMIDVDGRRQEADGFVDDGDGAIDASAEAARIGQMNLHYCADLEELRIRGIIRARHRKAERNLRQLRAGFGAPMPTLRTSSKNAPTEIAESAILKAGNEYCW